MNLVYALVLICIMPCHGKVQDGFVWRSYDSPQTCERIARRFAEGRGWRSNSRWHVACVPRRR